MLLISHAQLDDIPPSMYRPPNPESSLNRAQQEQNATPVDSVKTKKVLLGIKGFIGVVFLFVVLVSSVLSKLTLVSLADRLRNATYYLNASKRGVTEQERTTAVTLYWYLQFVLLIPNFITLVRCLAFGVIGKTTRTYPWPRARAIFLVSQECSGKWGGGGEEEGRGTQDSQVQALIT